MLMLMLMLCASAGGCPRGAAEGAEWGAGSVPGRLEAGNGVVPAGVRRQDGGCSGPRPAPVLTLAAIDYAYAPHTHYVTKPPTLCYVPRRL